MNLRIKELYTQVCLDQKLPFTLEHNSAVTLDAFADQFAELIVRECASMAESFHHHQYDFTGNLELHEFIKEHFGVEE